MCRFEWCVVVTREKKILNFFLKFFCTTFLFIFLLDIFVSLSSSTKIVSIYFYLASQSVLLGMNGVVTINISVRRSSTTGSRVFLWFLRGETNLVQKAALISPGTSRRGVEKGAHAAMP